MSNKSQSELEKGLSWVEQLHEDLRLADYSTALEESLPKVVEFVESKNDRTLNDIRSQNDSKS